VELKSDAATEKPKDQLSRDFAVVRFSTLATIFAKTGPSAIGAFDPSLPFGDQFCCVGHRCTSPDDYGTNHS
jgi:hypothetical protein